MVARHVAAGHYRVLALAKMIVEGRQLPDISREGIDQANAQHAYPIISPDWMMPT